MVRSAFGSRLVMARLIHVGFPWNALATGLRLKPGRRDSGFRHVPLPKYVTAAIAFEARGTRAAKV